MSDPYSQSEAALRADLIDARLRLHHEKSRREQAEAALAVAERKVAWLQQASDLIIWDGTRWQQRKEILPR